MLPVGGIREKILAAARAGMREVLVPEANRPEVAAMAGEDSPEVLVRHVATVFTALPLALA